MIVLDMVEVFLITIIEHQSRVDYTDEIADFTDQILDRRFSMLFDSFEAYDVQETRRVSREEGRIEGRSEGRIEGKIIQIQKKILKNKELEVIADELEENVDDIRRLYEVVKANLESSVEEILKIWKSMN